jgi:hypothetical protein
MFALVKCSSLSQGSNTGSSSRLPHSSVSQPSVPFLSLVPGTGLLDSDAVLGGLAGVCNIHHSDSAVTATTHDLVNFAFLIITLSY